MAKGVFFGVAAKSRKVRKMYIGIAGKARKVKKAYVGIGGKARLFFSSGAEAGLYVVSAPGQQGTTNLRCYRLDPATLAVLSSVEISQIGYNIIQPQTIGTEGKLLIGTTVAGQLNSVDPLTGAILETVTVEGMPVGISAHPGMGGNQRVFYVGVDGGTLGMSGAVYDPSSYQPIRTFTKVTFPKSDFFNKPTGGGAPDTMFAIGCVKDSDGDNDYYTAELDVNTMAYRRQVAAQQYPCTIDVYGSSIYYGATNRQYLYKMDYSTLARQATVDVSSTIPTAWGRNFATIK